MEQQNEVRVLARWGLTINQAKAYLALYRLGTSKVQEISENTKITHGDIYRIMLSLEKIGLVIKVVSIPTKYSAIPIKDAIAILKKRKTEENVNLEKATEEMMQKFSQTLGKMERFEAQHFVLYPNQRVLPKRKKALKNVQKSLDVITSLDNPHSILHDFREDAIKAAQRGVKIRLIMNTPFEKMPADITDDLKEYDIEVRYNQNPPPALMAIYDNQEARIFTENPKTPNCRSLWVRNAFVLSIFQQYFETQWSTAAKED